MTTPAPILGAELEDLRAALEDLVNDDLINELYMISARIAIAAMHNETSPEFDSFKNRAPDYDRRICEYIKRFSSINKGPAAYYAKHMLKKLRTLRNRLVAARQREIPDYDTFERLHDAAANAIGLAKSFIHYLTYGTLMQ